MKINKKAFFLGILSGVVAPAMVNATPCQIPRNIPSISSYDRLSNKLKSDECQMGQDFLAVGNDIRESITANG